MTGTERRSLDRVLDVGTTLSDWMYELAQSPATPLEVRTRMLLLINAWDLERSHLARVLHSLTSDEVRYTR